MNKDVLHEIEKALAEAREETRIDKVQEERSIRGLSGYIYATDSPRAAFIKIMRAYLRALAYELVKQGIGQRIKEIYLRKRECPLGAPVSCIFPSIFKKASRYGSLSKKARWIYIRQSYSSRNKAILCLISLWTLRSLVLSNTKRL